MAMTAKFDGTCLYCRGPIVAGKDRIAKDGSAWVHELCATEIAGPNEYGTVRNPEAPIADPPHNKKFEPYVEEGVRSRGTKGGVDHYCDICHKAIAKGELHTVAYSMQMHSNWQGNDYRTQERFHTACFTPEVRQAWMQGGGQYERLREEMDRRLYSQRDMIARRRERKAYP